MVVAVDAGVWKSEGVPTRAVVFLAIVSVAAVLLVLWMEAPRPDTQSVAAGLVQAGISDTPAAEFPVPRTLSSIEEGARERQRLAQMQLEYEARTARAIPKIRRLPVDAFPNLPPLLADSLRARGCTVPQPHENRPANVISGEFFAPGKESWAVLCSVDYQTSLLVFREENDPEPTILNTTSDGQYVDTSNEDEPFYSRGITPVGRDFIMGHYHAYGGPTPPAITHQGVDDAFLEKASVTWYHHNGEWLQLTGAD